MSAAMDRALALFAADGRAYGMALRSVAATDVMDMPRRNLRHQLLLWVACTRNPLLRQWLPTERARARRAIAAYRALRAEGRA